MSSDAQAVVDVTLAAAEPTELLSEARYGYVVPEGGTLVLVDPLADRFLPTPRRASGTTTVYDPGSLAAVWDKYSTDASELYADPKVFAVTAVLNADGGVGDPAHRDHRAVLACVTTPAWQAWEAMDGRLGDQVKFAEHLEDRSVDLHDPSAADMLELAQLFEATTKVDFESGVNLGSGQRGLVYKETVAAKAGHTGQLTIPSTFTVAVQVFEGGDAYKMVARLRYRIGNGNLTIGYKLERPEDVKRAAFDDVVAKAAEACSRTPLVGTPFGATPAAR